jgi:hypothetical protein
MRPYHPHPDSGRVFTGMAFSSPSSVFAKEGPIVKIYAASLVVLGALWQTIPALADSRDDVLENVARCGRIVDAHAWLNCYYGAAQPMRDQLGLPPAPPAQIQAVPSRGAAAFAPAPAQTMGAAAQPEMAKAPPAKRKSGGIMAELFGGQKVVTNMQAMDYKFDAKGIFTITLADGSTWQQVGDDDAHPDWHGQAARLLVSIKTGALSSYSLEVSGDHHVYKVVRIR